MAEIAGKLRRKRIILGLSVAIPIGLVGGLIGLGGAEFRLPVLAGPLQFTPRRAVPINLAISMVTLSAALMVRGKVLPLTQILSLVPVITILILSAMPAAFFGATWVSRIPNDKLKRILLIVLLVIGLGLIIEAFLPKNAAGFIPENIGWQILTGVFLGIGIGLFSSVLGVAGGELIIPALVFAYGIDIKLAGTASLLISLPTVLVGVLRFNNQGGYSQKQELYETVFPMGIGSIIGAVFGGLMVRYVPTDMLKIILGLILCYSAWRIFA